MSTIGDYVEDIEKNDGLYQNWLPYLRLSGWIAIVFFRHVLNEPDDKFNGVVDCCFKLGENSIGRGEILPPMWTKLLKEDGMFSSSRSSSRSLEVILIADGGWRKHCLVIHRVGEVEACTYERMGTCELNYYDPPPMEHAKGLPYVTVEEWPSEERWKLECRWETITLK